MKRFLVCLLTVFSVVYANAVFAQEASLLEAQVLDQLEQDKAEYGRNLFAELGKFQKFDAMPPQVGLTKVVERVAWLSGRAQKADSDYRLGYALAVYQWKMGNVRGAALTLARADFRAFVDGQRCDDKSSMLPRTVPWRRAAQPVYALMRNAQPELKAEIQKSIEQEASSLAVREPSAWMCSGGSKQIAKLLKKYPEIGALDASKPVPQSMLEKYPGVIAVNNGKIELTDYSIQPDFVSDEVWGRELPRVIESFKKSYFSMLGIS